MKSSDAEFVKSVVTTAKPTKDAVAKAVALLEDEVAKNGRKGRKPKAAKVAEVAPVA
jgi:hypothetical protein